MVYLTAEYRTRTSHDVPPQVALADAKSALRWVRTHAEGLGIDPDRIAVGGGSAGGHLAIGAVLCAGFDDPADPPTQIHLGTCDDLTRSFSRLQPSEISQRLSFCYRMSLPGEFLAPGSYRV